MKNYISKVIYYYDYIYYRIATGWIYGKSYKKYKMSYYSSAIVSILQYLIFFNALMTFILMKFSIADLNPTQQIVAIILAVIAGVHIQINNFHYKNKYEEYEARWANLDQKRKDRLDLIVLLMAVIPLIYLPVLTNVVDFTK